MLNSYETIGSSQVKLKVAVVGGGIAGLASAYALHLAGMDVVAVIEQGSGTPQPHGGLLSTYGMTTILENWGLGPQLRARAQECTSMVFRHGAHNHIIGVVDLGNEQIPSLFLHIQHADLHAILSDAVRAIKVPIMINTTALEVRTSPNSAEVSLSNGSTLTVDIVIGADGLNSALRSRVAHTPKLHVVGSPVSAPQNVLQLAFTVPVSRLEDDRQLGIFMRSHEVPIWLEKDYLLRTHVVGDGTLISGTLTYGSDPALLAEDPEWSERSFASLGLDMQRFDPLLQRLFGRVDRVSARVIKASPLPGDLVCRKSRIVLVGDAAHPVSPPRPALSFEDADTLGIILGRLETRGQLGRFLNAYDEIRVAHHAHVVKSRSNMEEVMALAPDQDADEDDVEYYRDRFYENWETEMPSLFHSPADAVEGHWRTWEGQMGCPEQGNDVTRPREVIQILTVSTRLPLTVE